MMRIGERERERITKNDLPNGDNRKKVFFDKRNKKIRIVLKDMRMMMMMIRKK